MLCALQAILVDIVATHVPQGVGWCRGGNRNSGGIPLMKITKPSIVHVPVSELNMVFISCLLKEIDPERMLGIPLLEK